MSRAPPPPRGSRVPVGNILNSEESSPPPAGQSNSSFPPPTPNQVPIPSKFLQSNNTSNSTNSNSPSGSGTPRIGAQPPFNSPVLSNLNSRSNPPSSFASPNISPVQTMVNLSINTNGSANNSSNNNNVIRSPPPPRISPSSLPPNISITTPPPLPTFSPLAVVAPDGDSDEEPPEAHTPPGPTSPRSESIDDYKPRVTIYERKEFRMQNPPPRPNNFVNTNIQRENSNSNLINSNNCKINDCWQKAEVGGMCIKHFYAKTPSLSQLTGSSSNNSSLNDLTRLSLTDSGRMNSSPSPKYPTPTQTLNNNYSNSSSNNNNYGIPPLPNPQAQAQAQPPSQSPTLPTHSLSSSKSDDKRAEERKLLAEELVSTEKTYSQGLKAICRNFILRLTKYDELEKSLITKAEIAKCFGNVADVADLSQKLYGDLKKLKYTNQLLTPALGKTLLLYTPFFRLYNTYVQHFEESSRFLKSLRETRPNFDFFMTLNEKCENSSIESLMITPVQRIPRYLLLLRGIEKVTDANDPQMEPLQQAILQVENVARDINNSFQKRDARQRVIDVQSHLEGSPVTLVTPTRYHVRDGPLMKKYNNTGFKMSSFKRYWFFLFNDIIMYTTVPNAKGDCKLKYILPLTDMTVADVSDDIAQQLKVKNAFEIKSGVKDLFVYADNESDKKTWMGLLSNQISQLLKNKASIKAPSNNNNNAAGVGNNVEEDGLDTIHGAMRDNGLF